MGLSGPPYYLQCFVECKSGCYITDSRLIITIYQAKFCSRVNDRFLFWILFVVIASNWKFAKCCSILVSYFYSKLFWLVKRSVIRDFACYYLKSMQTEEGFLTCSTKSGEHLKICVILIISAFCLVPFNASLVSLKTSISGCLINCRLNLKSFFLIGISVPKMPGCLRLQLVSNGDAKIVAINVVKIINIFPVT